MSEGFNPKRPARVAAGQVEDAMRTWVSIVSRGVSQPDLETVNAVFDQFFANAQDYFNSRSSNSHPGAV